MEEIDELSGTIASRVYEKVFGIGGIDNHSGLTIRLGPKWTRPVKPVIGDRTAREAANFVTILENIGKLDALWVFKKRFGNLLLDAFDIRATAG